MTGYDVAIAACDVAMAAGYLAAAGAVAGWLFRWGWWA